jgi:hypothetical protein
MPELSLRKLKTHYFLSPADQPEQRRLDRLHLVALDDAFALANDQAGLQKDGELCLRNISTQVHLRLDSSEQSIASCWGLALTEGLVDAIRNAPPSSRVFFYSRQQAIFDLALSVSRGNYERAWAWQLLGLWGKHEGVHEAQAVDQVVQVLLREANLIVPTLRLLASLGYLPALARKFSSRDWQELSDAALRNANVFVANDDSAKAPSSRTFSYALRVLKLSRVLAGINDSGILASAPETKMCRAVATLAVLDAEPALLRTQSVPAVIAVIAESLNVNRASPANVGEKINGRENDASPFKTSSGTAAPPAVSGEEFAIESAKAATAGDLSTQVLTPSPYLPPDEEAGVTNEVLDPRRQGITEFGGLLFLLNLIELLEIPERILGDAALHARPLVWAFHQLAMALTPAGPGDPATLAFAGLAPDATPPSQQEQPATEVETIAISQLAVQVVESLWSFMASECESPQALLDFVCRRRAAVVADPAWIEIRFSLDDISTEIRRAGLDLDPGYVTCLGVVVKFIYE